METIQTNQQKSFVQPPEVFPHLSTGSNASWRFIPLTQDKQVIVDDFNYEWLNQWKWYAYKGRYTYYAARTQYISGGKKVYISMHRLILGAHVGKETDHRNRNGLDNRVENIRKCTVAENQHSGKLRTDNKSGYKGVHWHTNDKRWRAQIRQNGIRIYLGNYIDKVVAAKAYDAKALELFGEFAYTNF